MKKMKWMMAAAFGLISVAGFAQTEPQAKPEKEKQEHRAHRGHARGGKENIEEFAAALNLSAEQKSQWQALHEAKKQELKALKENTALSQDDKKAQMRSIRQAKQTELKKILNEEQFVKYQELRKEKMKAHRAKGHKRGDGKKGAR